MPNDFRTGVIALIVAVPLTACNTISQQLREIRSEKLVNVIDPFQCEVDEVAENNPTGVLYDVDRERLCVLTHGMSMSKTRDIADAAEIAYQKVAEYLGILNPRKITILVREEPKTSLARAKAPYGRIIIPRRYFAKGIKTWVLVHEITHALLGLSGPYVTGFEYDRQPYRTTVTRHIGSSGLLNEGLASYLQFALADDQHPIMKNFDLHLAARVILRKRSSEITLDDLHLNAKKFDAHGDILNRKSMAGHYLIAASFVKYLIEAEGLENFLKNYEGDDFWSAYGKDITQLQADWKSYIDADEEG